MTNSVILPATKRELKVKARELRRQRKIPAEYYGRGKENLHLALDYQTFRKIYREVGGSSLVDLQVEGETEPREILIHEVVYDPLTDEFQHVDLKQIERGKKIVTRVPIHLVGESPAVKNLGGVLTQNKNEIEIKALPRDLLKSIEVDISQLAEFGDTIRVGDLKIDLTKHEILEEDEIFVATILAPKTAEEVEEDLAESVGEAVSAEVAAEAEAEKAAALASKESDAEKKGIEKKEERKKGEEK